MTRSKQVKSSLRALLALCILAGLIGSARPSAALAQNESPPPDKSAVSMPDADPAGGEGETSDLPNLHPTAFLDWEQPIIVSTVPYTRLNSDLVDGQVAYVDLFLVNDGGDKSPPFAFALYVDNAEKMRFIDQQGLTNNWVESVEDQLLWLKSGWHYLELRVDILGEVQESDETDNSWGQWFYWQKLGGQPRLRVDPQALEVSVPAGIVRAPVTTLQRDPNMKRPSNFAPNLNGLLRSRAFPMVSPGVPLPSFAAEDLPPAVDLSAGMPPVGDQGGASSCTGWATSYYLKSFQEAKERRWTLTTPAHQFSPNFVWNQIQPVSGNCGATSVYDALNLLVTQGDLPLADMPYSQDCSTQPTQEQRAEAAPYKAQRFGLFFNRFSSVPGDEEIQAMKAWLANGDAIVIGANLYDEFNHQPSNEHCIVDLPHQSDIRGGHAITLVGYDDNIGGMGKGGFKMVNSWGSYWGCGGYAYLTYDWVKDSVWEAYWMYDLISQGSQRQRELLISNDGSGTLTLDDVRVEQGSAWLGLTLPESLPFLLRPGESKVILVNFNPAGLISGSLQDHILLSSNDPASSLVKVPVSLRVSNENLTPPGEPQDPVPAAGALDQIFSSLSLSWSPASTASGSLTYDMRLSTANPPTTLYCNDTPQTQCTVRGLLPGTTYYWRVNASNGQDVTSGPVWSFSTTENESPFPEITFVNPSDIPMPSLRVTLNVLGKNFVTASQAYLGEQALDTTFLSGTSLRVEFLAEKMAGGKYALTVVNPPPGGGESAAWVVTLLNPLPKINSIAPNRFLWQESDHTFEITGENFLPNSQVWSDSDALATTYLSPTRLQAVLPARLVVPGYGRLKVENPAPGGGSSTIFNFFAQHPSLSVTDFSPRALAAHESGTLEFEGTGFSRFTQASLNGHRLAPGVLTSSGRLQIPFDLDPLNLSPGLYDLVLTNPAQGGQAKLTFQVLPTRTLIYLPLTMKK